MEVCLYSGEGVAKPPNLGKIMTKISGAWSEAFWTSVVVHRLYSATAAC